MKKFINFLKIIGLSLCVFSFIAILTLIDKEVPISFAVGFSVFVLGIHFPSISMEDSLSVIERLGTDKYIFESKIGLFSIISTGITALISYFLGNILLLLIWLLIVNFVYNIVSIISRKDDFFSKNYRIYFIIYNSCWISFLLYLSI